MTRFHLISFRVQNWLNNINNRYSDTLWSRKNCAIGMQFYYWRKRKLAFIWYGWHEMRFQSDFFLSYNHVGGNVHRHHINWRQSCRTQLSFFFVDDCKFATLFFLTSFHDVLAPNFTTSPFNLMMSMKWWWWCGAKRDKMSRNKSNSNQNY
jgi:hypothetical protein